MLLTEEQAKEKWCPFARVLMTSPEGGRASAAVNRVGEEPYYCRCIGSACMAWRWFDTVTDDGTGVNLKPSAHFARMPNRDPRPHAERRGFCGLAGSIQS